MTNEEIRELFRLGELIIVGSIKYKENPRDLDILQ